MWGAQALQWRLRGSIGIGLLAERMAREAEGSAGKAAEALLTLSDLLIVLREVDYEPGDGCLSRPGFQEIFQPFLQQLAGKLQREVAVQRADVSAEVMGFWDRVLDQCR